MLYISSLDSDIGVVLSQEQFCLLGSMLKELQYAEQKIPFENAVVYGEACGCLRCRNKQCTWLRLKRIQLYHANKQMESEQLCIIKNGLK